MSRRRERTEFSGQRVLLVGLGVHGGGVATARWLVRQGAKVRVTDQKTRAQLSESVQALRRLPIVWHLGGHDHSDFYWAERIIVNPSVSPALAGVRWAERHGLPIDNEASLFVRHFPGKLIGITGTRGKTTTTLLLGSIVKRAHRNTIVSGNVRQVAMLAHLPRTTSKTWAVLELSSYQLERLPFRKKSFDVAVMTNVKRDHLNRHGSLATYSAIKRRLFHGQSADQAAVLNADDTACRQVAKQSSATIWWYGPRLSSTLSGVTVRGGWVVEQRSRRVSRLFPLSAWRLPGQHNLYNLLSAVAAARALDISARRILASVRVFRGVPHRQEQLGIHGGRMYINDTAATSPDGTLAALDVYPSACFILGGTDKALDFRELSQRIVRLQAPVVFLPGNATEKLIGQLRQYRYQRPIVRVQSMRGAVETARRLTRKGQPIVLSPGAASFGLFQHEFDRGEQFRRIVSQR